MILNGAWRMYNGDQLYTDFFSFIAPGSYWWTELSFILLGPRYFSARFFSLLLLALSIVVIYRITILAGGSRFAAMFGALIWFLGNILNLGIINHNNHSSYVASVGVLFIILALSFNSAVYFFLAGLFIGITTIFLQTKGLALILGLGIFILVYVFSGKVSKKSFLLFCCGCLVVPVIVFYFWSPLFLYDTLVRWPSEHYLEINKVSYVAWFVTMVVFFAVSFLVFKIRKSINSEIVLVLAISQFFMMLAALTRSDLSHIFLASFGIIVLSVLALEKYLPVIAGILEVDQNISKNLIIFNIFLGIFFSSFVYGWSALNTERFYIELFKKYKESKIYAHPFLPGLYFELGSLNPYRYDFLLTAAHPEQAFLDNLLKLKQENPPYIFVDYKMVEKFGYNQANVLDVYISKNYELEDELGSFKILERNSR